MRLSQHPEPQVSSSAAAAGPAPAVSPAPAFRRFNLLPPGSALPTSARSAARVRPAPEVRPVNQRPNRFGVVPNQTRGVAGAWTDADPSKAVFTARVDGNFVGTTDEIIQWAACKWGVDEDYVRAQIVAESYWDQVNSLGDWGTTAANCEPRFPLGTNGRTGQCPESFGLGQTRYPFMRTAFPRAYDSSAYNLDVDVRHLAVLLRGHGELAEHGGTRPRLWRRRHARMHGSLVRWALVHAACSRLHGGGPGACDQSHVAVADVPQLQPLTGTANGICVTDAAVDRGNRDTNAYYVAVSRSTRRKILPDGDFGIASTNVSFLTCL